MIQPIPARVFRNRPRLYKTDVTLSQSAGAISPLPTGDEFRTKCGKRACTLFTSRWLADSCCSAFSTQIAEGARLRRLPRSFEYPGCRGWDVLLNEGDPLHADRRMNSITGRVLAIPAASVTNSGASSSRALHVELTSQQVKSEPRQLHSNEHKKNVHRAASVCVV